MKQETTFEEAQKEFEKLINGKGLPTKQLLEVAEHYFIVGYETAQERNHSDEDMKRAFCNGGQLDYSVLTSTEFGTKILNKWFEQFKKK